MDDERIRLLVDAPLKRAEVEVTPGCHVLEVLDLDTRTLLEDVTKVDVEAGVAWRVIEGTRRSHPWNGRYKLMCTPEALVEYKEAWKACL